MSQPETGSRPERQNVAESDPATSAHSRAERPRDGVGLFGWVALLGLIVAAYWPVFGADFILWDDTLHLTANPAFNPPRLANVGFFWRHPFFGMYIPVTYTAWMAVATVAWVPGGQGGASGLNPYIFHAANVLVHAVAAGVVWMLVARLTGKARAAWWGAAVFALHPLMVEPVAWVSGFRDVLAGMLSVAALYAYVRAIERREDVDEAEAHGGACRWPWYRAASVLFAAAVLAKPASVAVIPMALALDVFLLRGWGRWKNGAILLVPWVVVGVLVMFATRSLQPPPPRADLPPVWQRPVIAADAVTFYLEKLVWPWGLATHYGRSPRWVLGSGVAWKTVPVAIGAAAVVVWLGWRRRWVWAAGALFLAGLLPVLGLVPFGFQYFSTVADRYAYVAMLGPAVAVGFLLAGRARFGWRVAAIVVLLGLACLTYRQAGTWRSTESVFGHALSVNPRSTLALVKLSRHRLDRHDFAGAEQLAQRAVDIAGDDPRGWINLGSAMEGLGHRDRAEACYQRAIDLGASPDAAAAYSNLAGMRGEDGRYAEAEALYLRALELDPQLADARRGLALARARAKQRVGG